MCLPGQPPARPATSADAVAMACAGLAWLAGADVASMPAAEQADCLRALEQAEAVHTAARARVLAAFHAGAGFQDDGHGSAKTWLRWQTRITKGAAAGAMAWMRRLSAHPAVADALAAGGVSLSWARQVCAWSDLLPAACRADADAILLAAAADGADMADLAQLAEEMRRRTARPDTDGDDGFTGRSVSLDVTFGQSGKLNGDLTPQCTAAVGGARSFRYEGRSGGSADRVAAPPRRARGGVPAADRCGVCPGPRRAAREPTQIQVHMTLDQLRGLAWPGPAPGRRMRAERAVRRLIVARAADLMSGPGGLAAYLRTRLPDDLVASVSLPLDIGAVTDTIPVHLRRAVTVRDRHCRFPGCTQPATACQPHHIIPRSQGGPACLANLVNLCALCRRRHKLHYADLGIMPPSRPVSHVCPGQGRWVRWRGRHNPDAPSYLSPGRPHMTVPALKRIPAGKQSAVRHRADLMPLSAVALAIPDNRRLCRPHDHEAASPPAAPHHRSA